MTKGLTGFCVRYPRMNRLLAGDVVENHIISFLPPIRPLEISWEPFSVFVESAKECHFELLQEGVRQIQRRIEAKRREKNYAHTLLQGKI